MQVVNDFKKELAEAFGIVPPKEQEPAPAQSTEPITVEAAIEKLSPEDRARLKANPKLDQEFRASFNAAVAGAQKKRERERNIDRAWDVYAERDHAQRLAAQAARDAIEGK